MNIFIRPQFGLSLDPWSEHDLKTVDAERAGELVDLAASTSAGAPRRVSHGPAPDSAGTGRPVAEASGSPTGGAPAGRGGGALFARHRTSHPIG